MERNVELAMVIAMVVTALSHMLRPRAWIELFHMLRDRRAAGVFVVALLHLLMGLFVVATHNHWGGWPTVLTVLGWAWVIKGALYLTFPRIGQFWLNRLSVDRSYELVVGGAMLLALAGLVAIPLIRPMIG